MNKRSLSLSVLMYGGLALWLVIASLPAVESRSRNSGFCPARTISAFSRWMMSAAVFAGARSPAQIVASIGNPASAKVGISGASAERFALVTPSARSLPARMWGMAGASATDATGVSPATTAAAAGPPPL